MKSFVFKGELQMNYIYKKISYNININKEQICYIDKFLNLFNEKIEILKKSLIKCNIDAEDWDIPFIEEEAKSTVKNVNIKYISNQSQDWIILLTTIVEELIDKSRKNFLQVEKLYSDEIDRYEQTYDLLSNMFTDAEELIEIKYNEYINKKTNANRIYRKEEKINKHYKINYILNYKNNTDNYLHIVA